MGSGASSIETRWYVLLEKSLSFALNREVKLISAGMASYVSTQERLVLEFMVLPRKPDAVIILNGFNDAVSSSLGVRPGDPYNQQVLYNDFYLISFHLRRLLARSSNFFRLLGANSMTKALKAYRRHLLEDDKKVKKYSQSIASVYLDNVLHMLKRCEDRDIPCMVFVQPARSLTYRNQGIQREFSSSDRLEIAAYDEILKLIRSLAHDVPIYDLTSVFDAPGSEEWFYDLCHFTDPGHKAIADAMFPVVLDALRKKLRLSSTQDRH